MNAPRAARSTRIAAVVALLLGTMVSAASAETLTMPKRDMLRGTPQVVWGVTTLPNHTTAAPTTYSINFGDGTAAATGTVTDRSYIAVSHTYDAAGTFTATLQVTNLGTTETATVEVRVYDGAAITAEQLRGVRVNSSIEDGLRYLWVNQNNRAADFPASALTSWPGYTESFSALVVLAFENHNYRLDNTGAAPTGLYEKYVVRRGLNFIIDQLRQFTMTAQPAGDPCVSVTTDPCVGLRQNAQAEGYATALAILPLAGSNALDRQVSEITGSQNGGFVVGKTYRDVLQRMVNAMAWGQGDFGSGRGGWYYNFNAPYIDGSTIGWNMLALLDAAAAGITVPPFVKTEFVNYAIPTSLNNDGTFDYTGDNNPNYNNIANMVKAGVGLQAMFYADMVGIGNPRVLAARNAANDRWNGQVAGDSYPCSNGAPNKGCGYAMFNVFKGLKLQGITTLPNVARPAGPGAIPANDWYADYVDWLLANQYTPNTFTGGDWPGLVFSCCYGGAGASTAALAELILSNVALISPDPTLFSTVGLAPVTALLAPGGSHSVTATATSAGGAAVPGVTINFRVLSGPNADATGQTTTDASGTATFTYPDTGGAGRDTIQAFIGTLGSNLVEAIWQVPVCNATGLSVALSSPMFPLDQGWRGFTINGAPGATVTQICQDEAPNFENVASWAIDADGVGTSAARIRAQRSGTRTAPGNGRVYHIYFTSSNCTGEVTLGVPGSAGGTAVDNGPVYNSVTGGACAVPVVPAVIAAPGVVGDSQSVAAAKLGAAGLKVGFVSQLNHPSIPAGLVISQAPVGGTNVAVGSSVSMTVSNGPSSSTVPEVVGTPQDPATGFVQAAGLSVTMNRVNDASVPAGLVIGQSPIGGTHVPVGSAVLLTVSLGRAVAAVPNLVGLPLSGAVSTVGGAGLNFGNVVLEFNAIVPDGQVISQTPAPGSVVAPGSFVDFMISQGPQPVPVPSVIGQTQAAAEATLVNASLLLGTVTFKNDPIVAAGLVIAQGPAANLTARVGSRVGVAISLGAVMVQVPNVVGSPNVAAQTTIIGVGLAVGSLPLSYDAAVPAGSIVSQVPVAGASARLGSSVVLTVSRGPAPVSVPNVVGQAEGAATTSLLGHSLLLGTITRANSSTIPAGTVMGQGPLAGTPVPVNTAVNLLVSLGPVMVTVPDVRGAQQTTAVSTLVGAKLSVSVNFAASASVAAGLVVSQSQSAGNSVPLGSLVDLIVSSGPTIAVVPNLIGQTEAAAGLTITNASLTTGAITRVNHPTVPAGQVLTQNPGPGSGVPLNSAVALTVSAGPLMVTVPNVVGDTDTVGKQKLLAANLGYSLTYRADSVAPAHGLLSQDPAGGLSVPVGTMVTIVGSSGPSVTLVPDVVGRSRSVAEGLISAAGLTPATTQASHATVPAGVVISQTPDPGSNVPPSAPVSIVVSLGPPVPTAVPNVVGEQRANAEQAITASGFIVGTVGQVNDANVPPGVVISQTPAGDSSALRGSAIDLVVSLGSFIPGVPNSVELQLSSLVVGSGAPVNVTSLVKDGFGTLVTPTPPVTYEILSAAGALGTPPAFSQGVISTSADTRGAFTLRASVDGTGVIFDRTFVVVDGAPEATNVGTFVKLGAAEATVAGRLADLAAAYQGLGTSADVASARAALAAALLTVPITGSDAVRQSVAVAPEIGFLPTTEQLTAAGYPLTAQDVAYGNLLTQITAKFQQIITFYDNVSADATVGAGDSLQQLNTLNTQLAALQSQLSHVHLTPHGAVRYATAINYLVGTVIPAHLHALTNKVIGITTQYPDPLAVPAGVALLPGAQQYFARLKATPGAQTPDAFYARTQPAFFGLLGMMAGSSLQMELCNKMYGEIMTEVSQMMAVLFANDLLSAWLETTAIGDLLSGASLSFHAPGLPGSSIEGYGFDPTNVSANETWFIGPEAFKTATDLINKFKSAYKSLQGAATNVKECVKQFQNNKDEAFPCSFEGIKSFYDKVTSAVKGAKSAGELAAEVYDRAHTQASSVTVGQCVLDDSGGCMSLVFGGGFPDVNTTRFPSPVIVLMRNTTTGSWSSGIYNIVP